MRLSHGCFISAHISSPRRPKAVVDRGLDIRDGMKTAMHTMYTINPGLRFRFRTSFILHCLLLFRPPGGIANTPVCWLVGSFICSFVRYSRLDFSKNPSLIFTKFGTCVQNQNVRNLGLLAHERSGSKFNVKTARIKDFQIVSARPYFEISSPNLAVRQIPVLSYQK